MDDQKERERQELKAQILVKRQQIEFERTIIPVKMAFLAKNDENPEISEGIKTFYDPSGNVIERGELKELSEAEEDLIRLIDRLNKSEQEE